LGKRLIIVGFLLCFGIAIYVFWQRDSTTLRRAIGKGSKREPRMVMEEFTVYRYIGAQLEAQMSARLGQLFEPNVVDLDGEIRAEKYRRGETETVGAETATILFGARSISQMLDGSPLVKAEMNGFIEVGVKEHLLSTDAAVYTASDNTLMSSRPVRVDGMNRVFTSEDGFIYNIAEEKLVMRGLVKGVFALDAK
jgi:hypothetical protein